MPNKFLQFLVILKYLRKDYSELLFTFILVKKVIENNQAYVHSIGPVCQHFFHLPFQTTDSKDNLPKINVYFPWTEGTCTLNVEPCELKQKKSCLNQDQIIPIPLFNSFHEIISIKMSQQSEKYLEFGKSTA